MDIRLYYIEKQQNNQDNKAFLLNKKMFILVKYGANETLLCNPSCTIINLLTSIKRRSGLGNTDLVVDVADETGE